MAQPPNIVRGRSTPFRPINSTLNNGSLHTAINPNAGLPGQLPFSNIAAMNEDLRLVCNGIPIQPSRLVTALDGYPGGGTSLVIPNPNFPACLAQNPNCPPFFLVNTGTAISAPTGSINVRPWFPIDDTIYQICGWGGKKAPKNMTQIATSAQQPAPTIPTAQGSKPCCGSPLGLPAAAPMTSAMQQPSYFSFPAPNWGYAAPLPMAYNSFGNVPSRTPYFNSPVTDSSSYSSFGGETNTFGAGAKSESDTEKKEDKKDEQKDTEKSSKK